MKARSKQIGYLWLTFLTVIAGYAFLRYAYKVTDTVPFTQEIILILLGTIATIFITALLLNQQTTVEIEKEQGIKFLELKASTYERLLDLIEKMSLVDRFTMAELTNLQFITHRLAIVASPDVLKEYQNFLNVISTLAADNSFTGDVQLLSDALGALTVQIRNDLFGDAIEEEYTKKQIQEIIKSNSDRSTAIKNG